MGIPQSDGGGEHPRIAAGGSIRKASKQQQKPVKDVMKRSNLFPPPFENASKRVHDLMAARKYSSSLASITRRLQSVTIQSRRSSQSPSITASLKRNHDSDTEDQLLEEMTASDTKAKGCPLGRKFTTMKVGIGMTVSKKSSTSRRSTRHS